MSRHGSRARPSLLAFVGQSCFGKAADLQRGEIDADVAMLGISNRNAVSPGRAIRPRGNPKGRRCSRRDIEGPMIRDEVTYVPQMSFPPRIERCAYAKRFRLGPAS